MRRTKKNVGSLLTSFRKRMLKLRKKSVTGIGFTMIEILVVVAIIGILTTLAIISYTGAQRQARDTQRKSDIKQYQMALESYSAKNNGTYPVSAGGSVKDLCDDGTLEMTSCPSDPDDEEYYYYASDGVAYTLSAGLESKEVDWVASSDGTTTERASTSTSTPTSVATRTSTPTSVATALPTATPTVRPTTTPTPTACTGCYSGGVCYPGTELTRCGYAGNTCQNCSLLDRPDLGVTYVCEDQQCQIPLTGEPL